MYHRSNYGTEEQKEQYLPAMVAGTNISAIAMTEPGAGSDLAGIRTVAKKDGDDYVLNGSKTYITNGWLSDTVIIVAKTAPDKGGVQKVARCACVFVPHRLTPCFRFARAAHGISLFLVDTNTPGFTKGNKCVACVSVCVCVCVLSAVASTPHAPMYSAG